MSISFSPRHLMASFSVFLLCWTSCDHAQSPTPPPPSIEEAPPIVEVEEPQTLKEKLLYQPKELLDLTAGEAALAEYAANWCREIQPLLEEGPIQDALEAGQYQLIVKTNSFAHANTDDPPAEVETLRAQLLQCVHLKGVTAEHIQQQWYEEASATNRRRPVVYLWLEVDLPEEE